MSCKTAPTTDPEPSLLETPAGPLGITREGPEDAPVILCCHGIPGNTRDFRYLAPRLALAFHVVRVDMPGFGSTPLNLPPGKQYPSQRRRASVRGWADALDAAADALEVERYSLLAHSFAVGAVLECAIRRPDRVDALALLAVPGARRHKAYAAPPLTWRALSIPLGIPVIKLPLAKLAHWTYDRIGLAAPRDPARIQHQVRVIGTLGFSRIGRLARQVKCPVRLFHCANDRIVEPAIPRELSSLFVDCEATFYERGGHHIQKSHAAEIGEALSEEFGKESLP